MLRSGEEEGVVEEEVEGVVEPSEEGGTGVTLSALELEEIRGSMMG